MNMFKKLPFLLLIIINVIFACKAGEITKAELDLMPDDLRNLIVEYANPDFEIEYNRIRQITTDDRDQVLRCLQDTRQLKRNLMEVKPANVSLLNDIMNLESELVLKLVFNINTDDTIPSIFDILKQDYQHSDQELFDQFNKYVSENKYKKTLDDVDADVLIARMYRFTFYLLIKNSPLLLPQIKLLQKLFLAQLFVVRLLHSWIQQQPEGIFEFPKIEDDKEKCAQLDKFIEDNMQLFNADKMIDAFRIMLKTFTHQQIFSAPKNG